MEFGSVACSVPMVLNGQVPTVGLSLTVPDHGAYACPPCPWIEGTEALLEPCLSLKLQGFPALLASEEEFFKSTVPSQEVEALKAIDFTWDLGFFGVGSFR